MRQTFYGFLVALMAALTPLSASAEEALVSVTFEPVETVTSADGTRFIVDGDALVPVEYWTYRSSAVVLVSAPANTEQPAIVDYLYLYNDAAAVQTGGITALEEWAENCVRSLNDSYLLSRIWIYARLAGVDHYAMLPHAPSEEGGEPTVDLLQRARTDPEINAIRDSHDADLVVFVRENGSKQAWRPLSPDPALAFSHLPVGVPCNSNSHEGGGHNLGMDHNIPYESVPADSDPHPEARGFEECGTEEDWGRRTIMASYACPNGGTSIEIPVFSNPDLRWNGEGGDEFFRKHTSGPFGSAKANNAGVANRFASAVAAYRSPRTEEDTPGGLPNCTPTPEAHCLNGGRFRVSASWSTPDGTVGMAKAKEESSDTGLFWFFRKENIEMIVKVLDGCSAFGHYWVFVAGLTNVEVVLRVEDTSTGLVKFYQNPQGQAFLPIQDTTAFATCE